MNENAKRILAEAGAEYDPAAEGVSTLVQRPEFENETFLNAIAGLRRFVGGGSDVGGRRPGGGFCRAVFAHGASGAHALLAAYMDTVDDAAREKAGLALWRALAPVARVARREGHINFDLDSWVPYQGNDGKSRLVVRVSEQVSERVRSMAFATRSTISGIAERALAAEVERYERDGGSLPTRPEAAEAVAS
jgi:hypothetical protein